MKTRTEQILAVMNVLAWVTFIGLLIKGGAILVSFGISTINLVPPKNLYRGLDLSELREFSFLHFTVSVFFMVAILVLEAYVAFLVIRALSKIKMANPFTIEVSNTLERISYFILAVWIVAMLANAHTSWLSKRVDGLHLNIVSGEFIFLAGVVFVFSQIFKKGVEIQAENELTV